MRNETKNAKTSESGKCCKNNKQSGANNRAKQNQNQNPENCK